MSYASNSAMFNPTAVQLHLLKNTPKSNPNTTFFHTSGSLWQTAVCSGNLMVQWHPGKPGEVFRSAVRQSLAWNH